MGRRDLSLSLGTLVIANSAPPSNMQAIKKFKNSLYFPISKYFLFWGKIALRRWNPKVVVLTGSSGKSTLLSMLEVQVKDRAVIGHRANSVYGVPLFVLGLKGISSSRLKWLSLFILAPIKAFRKMPSKKIFIVEADADRPKEGKYLGRFLKPDICIWVSSARTHSMNFEHQVASGQFNTVDAAIANEFAYFARYTKELVITNGDNPDIVHSLKGIKAKVDYVELDRDIKKYKISKTGASFTAEKTYTFPQPQPPRVGYQVVYMEKFLKYIGVKPKTSLKDMYIPPGRSRVFKGKKSITIVDSSYNANYDSFLAILEMFKEIPSQQKWLVMGDMLELGGQEAQDHRRLAQAVLDLEIRPKAVVLLGPRIKEYAYPVLKEKLKVPVVAYDTPDKVLEYLEENLKGGETILFKGARFLEGVIESLLKDKKDAKHLPRRMPIWKKRRQEWNLP